MARHVLVGGGTGYIGQNLCKCLDRKGFKVTNISRMPGKNSLTWHEIEKNGIPSSVDAVVNLAGQNVLDPMRRWTEGFKQNVVSSRVNTSKALATAIANGSNVDVFINMCGISHYKPNPQRTYTENDPVSAYDFMSKLCLDWENAVDMLPFMHGRKCRVVKIRSGVVIGRGGGMIHSIWWPFQLGLGGPMGSGKQILPWIHMKDLCQLIVFAIENDKVEGVLNGVAPDLITNAQFSKTLAKLMNRPCIFTVPEFIIKEIFGRDRAALLLSGPSVIPRRVIDYGFQYSYPTAKNALTEVVYGDNLKAQTKINSF